MSLSSKGKIAKKKSKTGGKGKPKSSSSGLAFPYKRESYGYIKNFAFPTSKAVRNAIMNLPLVAFGADSVDREIYDNYSINCVTDYYSEEQRLAAQVKSRDGDYNERLTSLYPKVADMYNKVAQPKGGNEHLRDFIHREALFAKYPHHEATQFSVLLASLVYRATMEEFRTRDRAKNRSKSGGKNKKRYGGDDDDENMQTDPSLHARIRVLDMSSGWGDRLLAALHSGVDAYVGCDPNSSLQSAYADIIKDATDEFADSPWFANDDVYVEESGFLELNLDDTEPFHLAFTSPPFFAFEKYSDDDQQSINKFEDYVQWRDNFYFPMIQKAYDHIMPGGFLVLHLAPTFAAESLVIDAKKCAAKLGGCTELPDMMLDDRRNLGLYIWKKEEE